jgi:hypothetical protein
MCLDLNENGQNPERAEGRGIDRQQNELNFALSWKDAQNAIETRHRPAKYLSGDGSDRRVRGLRLP